MRSELRDGQVFDDLLHRTALGGVHVLKLDAHPRGVGLARFVDAGHPHHATAKAERLGQGRQVEREDELRADVERALRADERAAARNVLRVVGEEGVEPLVLDPELDRRAQLAASIGSVGRRHTTVAG